SGHLSSAHEAAAKIKCHQPLQEGEVLDDEWLVRAQRRADARQVVFRHAATTLEHHHCRVAGQANGGRNDERDGNDDENRLQHSLDEENGQRSFPSKQGEVPPVGGRHFVSSSYSTVTSVSFRRLSGAATKPFTRLETP